MHTRKIWSVFPAVALIVIGGPASAQDSGSHQHSDSAKAQQVIEDWPETSKKVAGKTIKQYGEPDGVTDHMLIWNNNDPWIRTIVHKEEIDHNFPIPHKDVLEQFINFEVPADKFSDLAEYDGSVVAFRTNGELSARCDKEGANFLALNLAKDIIEGKRTVDEARAFYAQTIQKVKQGEQPEYVQGLQFEAQTAKAAAYPDEPFEASEQVASYDDPSSARESQTGSARESQTGSGQSGSSNASVTAAEVTGKDLLSADGEVVGVVTSVHFSGQRGEEVAEVELNGFLGISGSRIELPLSKLSMTADGNVQTMMTDEELESMQEVGEEM